MYMVSGQYAPFLRLLKHYRALTNLSVSIFANSDYASTTFHNKNIFYTLENQEKITKTSSHTSLAVQQPIETLYDNSTFLLATEIQQESNLNRPTFLKLKI